MTVNVNGINLYYEKSGNGKPLLLLHGNGETHSIFDCALAVLNNHFTVYRIDSRCHGKSDKTEELHYTDMAEDVYCFIKELSIEKPIVFGFSDGGIVGLLLAVNHPEAVSSLVAAGPNVTPDGLYSAARILFKIINKISPSPLVRLMLNEPNITEEQLKSIALPVYITCGTFDLIKQTHLKYIAASIPGAVFKKFPLHTHSSYIVKSTAFAEYLIELFCQ